MHDKNLLHLSVYLTSRGISKIGDFMLLIGINIMILNRTHSPTAVSILWILPAVAQLVVSSWAGSITDRCDKRLTMITIELIRAALIACMALTSCIWIIYSTLFFINGVGSFFSAAAAPYLTYLVPNHRRKRLNAINGTLQSGAIVIGPAVTGLIVHMTGRVSLALWLDAGTFVLSALSLLILPGVKIRTDNAAEKQDGVFSIWLIDLKSAIQVLKQRIFFTILLTLVTTFGTLGAATDSQEVVFARLALGLSSGDYSLLVTIAGIGYIMGAIFVTILANRLSLRVLISIGSIFTSCGFVLYAFSHSFILAAIGFIILGIFQSFSNAGFSTFYQISIPPEYMGRVLNITSPLTQVMTVLMTITGGLVASLIGVRLMTIGATLLVSLVSIVIVLTIISPRAKGAFRSVEVQS